MFASWLTGLLTSKQDVSRAPKTMVCSADRTEHRYPPQHKLMLDIGHESSGINGQSKIALLSVGTIVKCEVCVE